MCLGDGAWKQMATVTLRSCRRVFADHTYGTVRAFHLGEVQANTGSSLELESAGLKDDRVLKIMTFGHFYRFL